MNIWLKELSQSDGEEYLNLINTLSSYNDVYAKPIPDTINVEEFKYFLGVREKLSIGEDLPKSVMPTTTYWVMDDEKPIGYATLKHTVDPNKVGGHFGLCLLKEYQNKGLGTVVSELLSKEAYYTLGIKEVIFTSKNENIQSQKSVEHIGATLDSVHDGYHFYKLNLEDKFKEKERK